MCRRHLPASLAKESRKLRCFNCHAPLVWIDDAPEPGWLPDPKKVDVWRKEQSGEP
jgi:hypothetical protein